MVGCLRVVLVCTTLVGLPAVSEGQVRGGGVAVPGSPAGSSRSSGPRHPTTAPTPGPRVRPLESRLVSRQRPFGVARTPFFVLWFGYLTLYPSWIEDWSPAALADAAEPLPAPPDGVPTGGLQLDVEPRRAQVYVDGFYAGLVDSFSGYYHHLEAPAGPHRVDILLAGYQSQTFTVVVEPGRTTTYRPCRGPPAAISVVSGDSNRSPRRSSRQG